MILEQPDAYSDLCIEGQFSLIDDKPSSKNPVPPPERPAVPPALTEHVLALSATETFREWLAAWKTFCDSMRGTDPASAVRVAQELRHLGTISFNESLKVIDMAIDSLVDDALEADREHNRLDRAIDVYDRAHRTDFDALARGSVEPIERQMLVFQWNRRIDGIKATILRKFGEHRLANLLVTQPTEYARIRDEESIGRLVIG